MNGAVNRQMTLPLFVGLSNTCNRLSIETLRPATKAYCYKLCESIVYLFLLVKFEIKLLSKYIV